MTLTRMSLNPYQTYGITAGAAVVSWLPVLDTVLHVVASLVIIIIPIVTYLSSRKK